MRVPCDCIKADGRTLLLLLLGQVVFLHGLGDTAHGWASQMAELSKEHPHVKFILPTGAYFK